MESHPSPSSHHDKRSRPSPPWRQRGFGLLEAAMLVLLIGSVITVGFLVLQSQKPIHEIKAQNEALMWADRALVAYAAQHARLPCPVGSPTDDASACVGPGQKGWLPVKALQAVNPTGGGPGRPLRYMVYRGGDDASDLAVASNQFNPRKWDGEAHDFDAINGLDLCAVLANAASETGTATRGDRARTTDIDGRSINVAYGLSAAGTTPGDAGGRFDGINQQDRAEMEAPSRGLGGDYDDRVHVRDFNTLAQTLGCAYTDRANPDGVVLASLDMLALAVDVSDEVTEQNDELIDETAGAVKMAVVSEVFAIINLALAAASISNSVTTLATASAQLATAVATCPIPPFVSCGLIAPYTAAVTSASVAIGFASAATALAAGALAATSAGLALTVEARDMAKEDAGKGPADIAELTANTCIAAEGGTIYKKADKDGKLIDIPGGEWKDGLKQDVEALEKTLAKTIAEREATQQRLKWLGEIPSYLLDYPPQPTRKSWQHCVTDSDGVTTCHTDYESDADLKQRTDAWLAKKADMEKKLQPKLAAIRAAEDAYFHWETTVQDELDARAELNQMNEAIGQLQTEVAQCAVTKPTARDEIQRCDNSERALIGMTTCDLDILTAGQVEQRQCLAWKQDDHEEAIAAEKAAKQDYGDKLWIAHFMDSPPIRPYLTDTRIPGSWWCGLFLSCDALIVPGQHGSKNDERETYAMTYYKSLGLEVAVEEQTRELEAKREAYAHAQAQCDALRSLTPGGTSGGDEVLMLQGAENILRGADCKGATGPVTPNDCATPTEEGAP
ncbi:MAG TPA: hypothetical protein VLZ76_06120 [Lysobacter sp.]|nr:hypothetical protein [Lysobacter sp.]